MSDYKLDIFGLLNNINKKDVSYYSKLSEEEQKAFVPIVTMRWLSGTKNEKQIIFLNELVNPYVFSLHKHKQLLYNLMIVSASGIHQRYSWIKCKPKKTKTLPECERIVSEYFRYNIKQASDAIPLLSDDTILEIAEELGLQKEEVTKLKKELKIRT